MMPSSDWLQNITPKEFNERRLDTRRFDEDEAAKHARDPQMRHVQDGAPCALHVEPRDKAEVAMEYIAGIAARLEAGETIERCDLVYVMVLMNRHWLTLEPALESRIRRLLDWPQKHELSAPAPEPYDQHAMGMSEEPPTTGAIEP